MVTAESKSLLRPRVSIRLALLLVALISIPLAVYNLGRNEDHSAAYNAVRDRDAATLERIATTNPMAIRSNRIAPLLPDALVSRDGKVIQAILRADPDVRELTAGGITPLTLAIRCGGVDCVEVVRALIAAGAEIDSPAVDGTCPLHCALDSVRFGANLEVAEVLVERGADVEVVDGAGRTPLHLASQWGGGLDAGLDLLLANGAKPTVADDRGKTALHYVAENSNGTPSAIRLLLFHGAKVDEVDKQGRSPLHSLCARSANLPDASPLLDELLKGGANVNATDKDGNTPLHLAIEENVKEAGDLGVVEKMLTPDYIPIIKALLDAGADPARENAAGRAAMKLMSADEGRKFGVMAPQRIFLAGNPLTLWLQERKNGIWARYDYRWSKGAGVFSGPRIVAPPEARGLSSGYASLKSVVVPRERWGKATIRVDEESGTATYIVDTVEYVFDFKKLQAAYSASQASPR